MIHQFNTFAQYRNKGPAHQLVKCRDCPQMTRGGIRCKTCTDTRRQAAKHKKREPWHEGLASLRTAGGERAAAFVVALKG